MAPWTRKSTVLAVLLLAIGLATPCPSVEAKPASQQKLVEAESLRDTAPEDLFALRIIIPERELPTQIEVIVQAYSPYTFDPIIDLPITLDVTLEGEDSPLTKPSRHLLQTGLDGTTNLSITIPPARLHSLDLHLEASATHRGVTRSVESDVRSYHLVPRALISTDRKLYQPGQTVHIRGLWLDSSRRPMANQPVTLKIQDRRKRQVAQAELTTSNLGIASFDWPVPLSADPDDYKIRASPDTSFQSTPFSVRPYEPSTLWLEAKPQKFVLLPGDVAVVEVEARYANGDPLANAEVELLYVPSRRWGKKESEETPDETPADVRTDALGRATARLDLSAAFEDVRPQQQFRDLTFRVEVRDPITLRSESVRFELRLSRQQVHVYSVGQIGDEIPNETYVIAQWADGEPFQGWISIENAFSRGIERHVGRVHTDAFGVASTSQLNLNRRHRYQLLAFSEDPVSEDPVSEDPVSENPASEDPADTPIGQSRAYWDIQKDLGLIVKRPLSRVGEPLEIDLHVAQPMSHLGVFVFDAQGQLLERETLPVVASSTRLAFPYQDGFEGLLSVVALSLSPEPTDDRDMPAARRYVIYPKASEDRLRLEVSTPQKTYRPGETAHLDLELHHAQGNGSVAVALVDRATEARQASFDLGDGAALFAPLEGSYVSPDLFDLQIGAWSIDRILRLPEAERYGESAQQTARALLAADYFNDPDTEVHNPLDDQRTTLKPLIQGHKDVVAALARLKGKHPEHVIDPHTFGQALYELGVDLDALRDPWGQPYRVVPTIRWNRRYFEVMSNGRDGEPNTVDDFEVWSADWPFAHRLGQALATFARTRPAEAHSILSDPTLRNAAMAHQGLSWDAQKDPWGQTYDLRWSLEGRRLHYRLVSRGPDGVWQPEDAEGTSEEEDDITVWSFRFLFVTLQEGQLRTALREPFWNGLLPSTDAVFRKHLKQQGIEAENWNGPWGYPMFFTFDTATDFIDAWTVDDTGRKTLLPREQIFDIVRLWSVGSDGIRDTDDDLELTYLRRPRGGFRAHFKQLGYALPDAGSPSLLGNEGLLAGVVVLADGFPVPGVLISAVNTKNWQTISVDDGSFQLTLPPGSYTVTAELEGFATMQLAEVWILPGQQFHAAIRMEVEAVEETIVVTGESPTLSVPQHGAELSEPSPKRSTPRLRKDFPETLFWLADGRFDDDGRLRLVVPLADNLTRWHVAALASDAAGRLASAELDVTVTQPFFLLPDLPPLLTDGDVLQLPVDVHNRTGGEVSVNLELAEVPTSDKPWRQTLTAKEGIRRVVTEQTFDEVGTRNLRWTATSADASEAVSTAQAHDAVEKSTEVSWNGAQHITTQNRLLWSDAQMTVTLPEGALPDSGMLDVLIYGDLESHVIGVLQGLAKKPTGCAEQTTSSAWIHLLLLDRLIEGGQGDGDLAETSRSHVTDALASLVAFQTGPGFGYWHGSQQADLALTAYILEFLLTASQHLPVDAEQLDNAAAFLREQRDAKGRWPQKPTWLRSEAARLLHLRSEALVTRTLALHGVQRNDDASLKAAKSSLRQLHGAMGDDPYGLALLASTAGSLLGPKAEEHRELADIALDTAQRLLALAQEADGNLAWHLRSNSPFYGWGRSGRLSTTALTVQALASLQDIDLVEDGTPFADALQSAVGGGLSYLLLNKEANGTWFTTQSSVQSLRALNAVLRNVSNREPISNPAPLLDGQSLAEDLGHKAFGGPQRWTLPLSQGSHRLTLPAGNTGHENGSWRLVQTRVRSYLPWNDPRATPRSEDLAFDVQCSDVAPIQRGEMATCEVEIARVGYRGSGMLIAEIGLPPGAEVDEAALQVARQNRYIDDFEVWPGRVVLYVWPGYRNPTIRFTIPWRPRLALRAATQPSVLYDYYNPDARVVLPPRDVVVAENVEENGG